MLVKSHRKTLCMETLKQNPFKTFINSQNRAQVKKIVNSDKVNRLKYKKPFVQKSVVS